MRNLVTLRFETTQWIISPKGHFQSSNGLESAELATHATGTCCSIRRTKMREERTAQKIQKLLSERSTCFFGNEFPAPFTMVLNRRRLNAGEGYIAIEMALADVSDFLEMPSNFSMVQFL